MSDPSDFVKRLAEKRAELEAKKQANAPAEVTFTRDAPEFDADLVPDVQFERSPEDEEMDRVIDTIDIIQAYTRWCGKMSPEIKGAQRESIMISCPKPNHPDKKPSAWINLDKQTWYCGGCQEGGDAHDIAAYHFGFPVPGYKEGAQFHELRRKMAESMGWVKQTFPGGVSVMMPPADEPAPVTGTVPPPSIPTPPPASALTAPTPPTNPQGEVEPAAVTYLDPVQELIEDDTDDFDIAYPAVPWRDLLPKDTFLRSYMEQTSVDDVPEEYHFWNGLIALGMAMGKDVTLFDRIPVYGNLFVCTLGHSGSGKSQARYHLDNLMSRALPVDRNDPFSKGAEKVSAPASAEAMIYTFQRPIVDPSTNKPMGNAPVRGIIDFNELSSLIGRTNRQGNVMKPTLMQFYDMEPSISTTSMTTGRKEAVHPFASALTTTQPRALASLLSHDDVDSGFLNRWIFAGGPAKQRVAIGGIEVDIEPCVPYLKNIQGWCGFGRKLTWSEEAAHEFTVWYHERLEPIKIADDAGLLTRIDLTAKKLCLLLTANLRLDAVPAYVVQHVKLLLEYVIACYRLGGAQIGNTVEYQIRDDILRVIDKMSPGGASLRDINMFLKRKKYPQDKMVKVLDFMAKLGEVHVEATKGVGRPTVRYRRVG